MLWLNGSLQNQFKIVCIQKYRVNVKQGQTSSECYSGESYSELQTGQYFFNKGKYNAIQLYSVLLKYKC